MALLKTLLSGWFLSVCLCVCVRMHFHALNTFQLEAPKITRPCFGTGELTVPSHPQGIDSICLSHTELW